MRDDSTPLSVSGPVRPRGRKRGVKRGVVIAYVPMHSSIRYVRTGGWLGISSAYPVHVHVNDTEPIYCRPRWSFACVTYQWSALVVVLYPNQKGIGIPFLSFDAIPEWTHSSWCKTPQVAIRGMAASLITNSQLYNRRPQYVRIKLQPTAHQSPINIEFVKRTYKQDWPAEPFKRFS